MQSIQWLFNCHVVYCEQPHLLLCATFLGSITINNRPNVIIRQNKSQTPSSLSLAVLRQRDQSNIMCMCHRRRRRSNFCCSTIFQPCISSTNNVIFNVDTPSIANHYPEHRWWMICCYSSIKRVVFVTTDLIVDRPADLLKSKPRWNHPICCHRCWVRLFQELKSMYSWKKKKKKKKNDEKWLLQTKNV